MPNETPISPEEASIIGLAVRNAKSFGTGIVTTCREGLEMYGYTFTEKHERFIFENFFEKN